MLYLLPAFLLSAISLVVLRIRKRDFDSPEDHYLTHPGEFTILASNLSASFTVTTFWFLFIFSIKSWAIPSFYALQGGIVAAYALYALLAWREIQHKTFLNFVFGESPPNLMRWLFFGLAFGTIAIELGLGRSFLEMILVEARENAWIGALSILVLAATTILDTYSGGMYAVLMTDAIFIVLCVIVMVICVHFAGNFQWQSGFLRDFQSYDMRTLTDLDYLFYISAGLYVMLMFLFHPDYWYRNLRLPYKSKSRRLLTIGASAIATSILLQVAYYIAVYSRNANDLSWLNNNLVSKDYNIADVIEIVVHAFRFVPGNSFLY